jgi:hypothetical protein
MMLKLTQPRFVERVEDHERHMAPTPTAWISKPFSFIQALVGIGFAARQLKALHNRRPSLVRLRSANWSHDKNGVATRIEQVERSCAPLLVSWCSKDGDLCAPLTVIRICVIHKERYAGISAVTLHRTIESQLDCPALKPE